MIAFVTGATGCVGYALCRHLLAHPSFREVRVLTRGVPDVPPGCRVFAGSLDDTRVLLAGCAGAGVVYHAAAQVHSPDAPESDFERVNVGGTTKLLQAATEAAVPRFVYFSTVAVFGEETPPEGIAETAPPAPATPYARTKLRGELLVQEWAARTGGLGVILRDQNKNVFVNVGLNLILSVIFYVVIYGCKFLGENDILAPAPAAWLPVLIFGPFALVLFDAAQT